MSATTSAFFVHSISMNGKTYVSEEAPSGELLFTPEDKDNYSIPIPFEDILPSLTIGMQAGYPNRGYASLLEAKLFPDEPSFWVLSRLSWMCKTSGLESEIEPILDSYEKLEQLRAALR